MPAPLIPIIIAGANVVRMVAPTVARSLTQRGFAKAASKKAIEKAGGKIPKATRSEVEKISERATERKNLQNLSRAQKLDKQPKGEKPYQTLSRAEKQEKAARGASTNLTPRQEAARLKRLMQQQKKQKQQTKQAEKPKSKEQQTPKSTLNKGAGRKQVEKPKSKMSDAGKTAIGIATTAAGLGGLSSLKNNENKPAPRPKPKPEAKTAPRPKPKPEAKTAPRPKQKPEEKFDTEGGLYKQYEFAKKRDLPIGGATQKYYDQMENVALNKKGGMIKKSAVKKRKGFSGRGVGAARRGF
jgi:hypothetical protein